MLYLDTSVLLVYTLTQSIEIERFKITDKLFTKIISGEITAATSFYALHELYIFALENAPDLETGYAFGKNALLKVLSTPVHILPFVSRTERKNLGEKFVGLRDPSDVPHAIVAFNSGCDAIVAYDEHFRAISHVIPYKKPEDYVL
ncbi:MAG TPA: PIN domain-containing protein [Thermodesulfobacteriota bacterium]|nr:PIN domain-containing protein [Thermodesulfobacteriota bacterium]